MSLSPDEIANYLPVKLGRLTVNTLNAMDYGDHLRATMSVIGGNTGTGKGKKLTIEIKQNWKFGGKWVLVFRMKADRLRDRLDVTLSSATYRKKDVLNSLPFSVGNFVFDIGEAEYMPHVAVSYLVEACCLVMHQ